MTSAVSADMEHPKQKGDRTTLAVMLALRDAGFPILVPFGENTRYDLVIDDGGELRRVQCKTGRLRNGAVIFAVCSCYGHHLKPGNARRHYHGEVDLFAVYCPETASVYLVPIKDLDVKVSCALRVEPTRNRQRRRIRKAEDYRIAGVLVRATTKPGATAGAPAPSA
jgi:PD-(D/E)XK endonuclease